MSTPIVHRRRVLELVSPLLGSRCLELAELLDVPRRLAVSVESPIDVPGFDNSSMDGYALAAETVIAAGSAPIPVSGRVAAGSRGTEVAPGTAVEIMTGAPVPPGADTIIPIEATSPGEFESPEIIVAAASGSRGSMPRRGDFVRPRGSDVTAGTTILETGTMLGPAHLGVAAACGITRLEVQTLPRVLLVSTGDEIAAEADDSTMGESGSARIHDANSITLAAGLRRLGAEVRTATVPDDPAVLLDRVRSSDCELVISTGGISKGAHEVVKLAAAADRDAEMHFEAIAMQPGGPQGCGVLAGVPWVALPGNPVSALVSFELFIRPALLGLGVDEPPRTVEFHRLSGGLDEAPPSGKLQVRRAVLRENGLELMGGSRSHLLHNYARSTHLVFIPAGHPGTDSNAGAADMLECWRIQ